jgi:hypothetical protein
MNYFAHGRHFVDRPYFLAGTAVPDWLNVVDRKVRVRARTAQPHVEADDPRLAAVAAGIVQHCRDDDWFHGTRAFAELSLELCRLIKTRLGADDGFRPHFLGHILVEMLLDAALIADEPAALDRYYAAMDALDGAAVEAAVERIAAKPAKDLATFVRLFSQERFLYDYADDAKLLGRLNQVMRRVGLGVLPASMSELLATARVMVAARKDQLLAA